MAARSYRYSFAARHLFGIVMAAVVPVWILVAWLEGGKSSAWPWLVALSLALAVGGLVRTRRGGLLQQAIEVDDHGISSAARDGSRRVIPWGRVRRLEWISSGWESSRLGGAAGVRIVAEDQDEPIRFYRHIRGFDELLSTVFDRTKDRAAADSIIRTLLERRRPLGGRELP